ncbi:MAG: response regulator [Elusimicrobiota bacterium]
MTRKRIMVVDDDRTYLSLLGRLLEREGYECLLASSGLSALRSIGRFKPHLILLDLAMPEMNGFQLYQRLQAKKRSRDVPTMFVSGLDYPKNLLQTLAKEFADTELFGKSLGNERLLQRVKEYLRDASPPRPRPVRAAKKKVRKA